MNIFTKNFRLRVVGTVFLINFFIIIAIFLIGLFLLNLGFKNRIEASINLYREVFLKLVEKEKNILEKNLKDYIFWKDLGERGVLRRDENWLKLNINPWVKKSLGYDVVLFTESKELITSSLDFPIGRLINLERRISVSFIRLYDKFYLYAIGPIYDEDSKKFYNAYLIFMKEVDDSLIKSWEEFIGGKITILFTNYANKNSLRNYYDFSTLHIEIPLEEGILVHIDKTDNNLSYFYKIALFIIIFFSFLTLLMSIVLSHILLNRVFSPFEKLVAISQEIAKGNYDVSIDDRDDEIGHFMKAFKHMISKIKEREEKLITEKKFAEKMMYIDPLTKVYNRRFLEENFEDIKKENELFTLLFIDLDNFKEINDRYGHIIGDKILVKVAEFFEENFRDKDLIIRYGGDEFCIILCGVDSVKTQKIVKRIYEKFNKEFSNNFEIPISFSYGMAEYPKDGESLDRLIEKADKEMYKYKT